MAYTTTDLANLEAARLELLLGKRVVRLRVGTRDFEFAQIDLPALESVISSAKIELGQTSLRTYAKNIRRR